MMADHSSRLLELASELGVFRARDAAAAGIPTTYLTRLVRAGQLDRIGHGLYAHPSAQFTENTTLAEVAQQVPRGVICLLSALRFFDLGTQRPHRIWIALPAHASRPATTIAELEVVRMADKAHAAGVRTEHVNGSAIRIFGPSKTVADLFKFRNRVGLDVALEGLREYWRSSYRDVDALQRYCRINRVDKVIRPYLEAIAS